MKISNLSKNYNAKKVVNSVNLEIKKNKVTSFIGPNGAGKSTVMGMISRLILKDEGEIDFYDLDIAKWNSKELAKKLAILTQANNIQMKLTVYELVAFGRFPYSKGKLNELDKEKIQDAIDYMELNDIKNQYIDELSGGQRQRAFIAMVIAQDTEYVLLDEPTNNLDIYHATKLMRTVSCKEESADSSKKETVIISSLNQEKQAIELEVKKNPERIAILDMACLDIIDALGEGDKVVACATTTITYLEHYSPNNNKNIANIGTVKKADMEALYAAEPDIIFIGGRLSASYNELSKVATTVYLATSSTTGVVASTKHNAKEISKIFDKEDKVASLMASYSTRIDAIKEFSKDVSCLNTIVSGSSINVLNNNGNLSLIGVECGFNNLGNVSSDATHGDSVSFEYLVKQDPEYIFVLDRNSVTGDTNIAKDVVENEVVKQTNAYKNNKIIYLEHSNVWYTASGGITALGVMLDDLELGLGLNK